MRCHGARPRGDLRVVALPGAARARRAIAALEWERMEGYYAARAGEYEAVYAKPERQADLAELKDWLARRARGRVSLEVACGTGYWTAIAAATARAIVATDANAEPLAIARAKALGAHVTFRTADANALPRFARRFDCGMAHFWWSHVPRPRIGAFLAHFSARLSRRASLLLIDNRFVARSSTPIARRDRDGNTYQIRTLRSGARYEVIKNFPRRREIDAALRTVCSHCEVRELAYYWAAHGVLT